MGVADVHQAIQSTLRIYDSELNGLVVLSGADYGALIMGNLVAQHPDMYPLLSMNSPTTDLAAIRGFDRFLFTIMGKNYTRGTSVYSKEFLGKLWLR